MSVIEVISTHKENVQKRITREIGRVEYVEDKISNSTDSKELLSIMSDEMKALKAALIELQKLNTSL